jgi:hypothetical protein
MRADDFGAFCGGSIGFINAGQLRKLAFFRVSLERYGRERLKRGH